MASIIETILQPIEKALVAEVDALLPQLQAIVEAEVKKLLPQIQAMIEAELATAINNLIQVLITDINNAGGISGYSGTPTPPVVPPSAN